MKRTKAEVESLEYELDSIEDMLIANATRIHELQARVPYDEEDTVYGGSDTLIDAQIVTLQRERVSLMCDYDDVSRRLKMGCEADTGVTP